MWLSGGWTGPNSDSFRIPQCPSWHSSIGATTTPSTPCWFYYNCWSGIAWDGIWWASQNHWLPTDYITNVKSSLIGRHATCQAVSPFLVCTQNNATPLQQRPTTRTASFADSHLFAQPNHHVYTEISVFAAYLPSSSVVQKKGFLSIDLMSKNYFFLCKMMPTTYKEMPLYSSVDVQPIDPVPVSMPLVAFVDSAQFLISHRQSINYFSSSSLAKEIPITYFTCPTPHASLVLFRYLMLLLVIINKDYIVYRIDQQRAARNL